MDKSLAALIKYSKPLRDELEETEHRDREDVSKIMFFGKVSGLALAIATWIPIYLATKEMINNDYSNIKQYGLLAITIGLATLSDLAATKRHCRSYIGSRF